MSTIYDLILEELLEDTPENVVVTPPPYDSTTNLEIRILSTYQRLQRFARQKNRCMTLVHAYYLGEIIENILNRHQQGYLINQISKYYSVTSRRTYYLFEKTGVTQIYRTKKLTLRMIYKLKFAEYQTLVSF
jgi:hypothetical protein